MHAAKTFSSSGRKNNTLLLLSRRFCSLFFVRRRIALLNKHSGGLKTDMKRQRVHSNIHLAATRNIKMSDNFGDDTFFSCIIYRACVLDTKPSNWRQFASLLLFRECEMFLFSPGQTQKNSSDWQKCGQQQI